MSSAQHLQFWHNKSSIGVFLESTPTLYSEKIMYPYLFDNTYLPTYGMLIFLAIIICIFIKWKFVKLKKNQEFDFLLTMCFCLIGAVVGSKLVFILTVIPELLNGTYSFLQVIKGGFVFYGGLIGGFLGIYIYHLIYKTPLKPFLNTVAIILPLGQCIGRIGCFCGGCCYGRPTDSWLGVVYTHPADINTPIGVKLLPTQLFESACCLILFIFLFVLYLKKKNLGKGNYVYLYMILYSIIRFTIEFFRGDAERGQILFISTSQFISLILLIGATLCWLHEKKIITFKRKERFN